MLTPLPGRRFVRRKMFVDGRGFGEKTIERDHGRDRGEEGQQPVKDDAGRHCQKAVFSDSLIRPPQDIFPASRRNLPRRGSVAAPAWLQRPPVLRGLWLFRTSGKNL